MDVQAWALGISGVNFCPDIRFCEVNFAQALGNKGRYGCAGLGIRYFRGQFLPGH